MIRGYDIKEFYQTKTGVFARDVIAGHVNDIWPQVEENVVLGLGHAFPFLQSLDDNGADRVFGLMPPSMGSFLWIGDAGARNKAGLSHLEDLPLPDESIDRVLLIHGLEFCNDPNEVMNEIWRVLKPNGRLLVAVPSRLGTWTRADRTPFGHGRPYSMDQLRQVLKDENFVLEHVRSALFTPPFKSKAMLKCFGWLEKAGAFMPLFSGLYFVEASKQVFALTKEPIRVKPVKPRNVNIGATPQPS